MSQSGPSAELINALYWQIRLGNWPFVMSHLRQDVNLAFSGDPTSSSAGWSISDHAAYQGRVDILSSLAQNQHVKMSIQTPVMFALVYMGAYQTILWLLENDYFKVNKPDVNHLTLLDHVEFCKQDLFAKDLREKFQARTHKELPNLPIISVDLHIPSDEEDTWVKDLANVTSQINQTLIFSDGPIGISQLIDTAQDEKFIPRPQWKPQPPIGSSRRALKPR